MTYTTRTAWANPHNYSTRKGHLIDTIIIHAPQGTLAGMRSWFQMEAAAASAHFGVGIDGVSVEQYVDESYAAWHAGNALYNRRSIGVEVEAKDINDAIPDFLAPQIELLAGLCADLCKRYAIPTDRAHIIGHHEVPCPITGCRGLWGGAHHHTDPGPQFPWESFMTKLQQKCAAHGA